jgi:hypothetical protein
MSFEFPGFTFIQSLCINSWFVILRFDRGIHPPLKKLDSPIESENDGMLGSQFLLRLSILEFGI